MAEPRERVAPAAAREDDDESPQSPPPPPHAAAAETDDVVVSADDGTPTGPSGEDVAADDDDDDDDADDDNEVAPAPAPLDIPLSPPPRRPLIDARTGRAADARAAEPRLRKPRPPPPAASGERRPKRRGGTLRAAAGQQQKKQQQPRKARREGPRVLSVTSAGLATTPRAGGRRHQHQHHQHQREDHTALAATAPIPPLRASGGGDEVEDTRQWDEELVLDMHGHPWDDVVDDQPDANNIARSPAAAPIPPALPLVEEPCRIFNPNTERPCGCDVYGLVCSSCGRRQDQCPFCTAGVALEAAFCSACGLNISTGLAPAVLEPPPPLHAHPDPAVPALAPVSVATRAMLDRSTGRRPLGVGTAARLPTPPEPDREIAPQDLNATMQKVATTTADAMNDMRYNLKLWSVVMIVLAVTSIVLGAAVRGIEVLYAVNGVVYLLLGVAGVYCAIRRDPALTRVFSAVFRLAIALSVLFTIIITIVQMSRSCDPATTGQTMCDLWVYAMAAGGGMYLVAIFACFIPMAYCTRVHVDDLELELAHAAARLEWQNSATPVRPME